MNRNLKTLIKVFFWYKSMNKTKIKNAKIAVIIPPLEKVSKPLYVKYNKKIISKNMDKDNWTLVNINTDKIKTPKPIMVATWLGPKLPEVEKFEDPWKTNSSRSGVLKYTKLIIENTGNKQTKSNSFNCNIVMVLL